MTDLSQLKVSLTKHNAHKVASLLKKYRSDQVLSKLAEVQAEPAQAHKNLSALDGTLPQVWEKSQQAGENAIDALVFVGIVFSHHQLIDAMINASGRSGFTGSILRGVQLDGKAYTNFVRIIDQLGFATKIDYPRVDFNLKSMFEVAGLGPLVGELLGHKLASAGWDRTGAVSDEGVRNRFHEVFGLTPDEFRNWVSAGVQPQGAGPRMLPKDDEFFQSEEESSDVGNFEFRSGHTVSFPDRQTPHK